MKETGRLDVSGLRVLMTADAVGGVFSYAVTLVRTLCEAGAQVTLVLQGPPAGADKRATLDGIAGLRVIDTDLALEWRDPDGADAMRARRTLARIEADVRPDVVHLNGFRDALAEFHAPTVVVAHSCVDSWWRACRGGVPDDAWANYARDVSAGLSAADAWIAPSHWYRDMTARLHAPRTRGHVVHNGIVPVAQGASCERVVLAAGRVWDEAKDFATLITAAPEIAWRTEIAGAREQNGRASPDNEPEGRDARLRHLGPLPQDVLRMHMAHAGIFVSPAVYEPFGLGVLEAAAAGCALVLSDIPSFRELWGDTALFFTPRDAPDLARQVNRLAQDDTLRAELRARSIAHAARYSAADMAAGTLAVYRTAMDRAPASVSAPASVCVSLEDALP